MTKDRVPPPPAVPPPYYYGGNYPEHPVAPAFLHPIPEFPGIPGGEKDEGFISFLLLFTYI